MNLNKKAPQETELFHLRSMRFASLSIPDVGINEIEECFLFIPSQRSLASDSASTLH